MLSLVTWDFVLRFLNITLIDLALSGDNALVIGIAAASVSAKRRMWVILIGGGMAIMLRILLTSIATLLMLIPLLSAAGGIVLFWVAYKLLRLGVLEGRERDKLEEAKNFRQALVLILAADFMMSLDNIIAVAGTAHGNVTLLIAGLLLSMPLLMTTGGAISLIIDRFRWLVFVGALAIAFTATRMVLEDRYIEARYPQPTFVVLGAAFLIGLIVPAFFVWLNKRGRRDRAGSSTLAVDKKSTPKN